MTFNKRNTSNLFYIFITTHLFVWTLVPSITNNNLSLDTIEALAWGSNLDWGFNKHPPASAFFVENFYGIFGNQDWAYYLLSQIICGNKTKKKDIKEMKLFKLTFFLIII